MNLEEIIQPLKETSLARFEDDTNRTIGWLQTYLGELNRQPSHAITDDAKKQVQLAIDSLERLSQMLYQGD